jgi:hypothetical protein
MTGPEAPEIQSEPYWAKYLNRFPARPWTKYLRRWSELQVPEQEQGKRAKDQPNGAGDRHQGDE